MTNKNILTKWYVVTFLAFVCCFLWGSAFPMIKVGYELLDISADNYKTQILFAGIRFFFAGILTILIGSFIHKQMLKPTKESYKAILVLAVFQTVIQYLCFYIGLANTTGVKGAIITGSNTLIAIIFATLIFKQEKITKRKIIGCVIGFIGVIIANLNSASMDLDFKFIGEGMMLISAVSYALSSVFIKKYSLKHNPVMLSGYQFAFGGIALMIIGLILGGNIKFWNVKGVLVLLYLSLVSAVAYSIWGILLKYNPVSTVTVYGFMNPIIGVLLSALILGEKDQALRWTTLLALLLVVLGIYIVNRVEKKKGK